MICQDRVVLCSGWLGRMTENGKKLVLADVLSEEDFARLEESARLKGISIEEALRRAVAAWWNRVRKTDNPS